MEAFLTAEGLASFVTLSLLEIILGIDNLIFISLVANTLPKERRNKVRVMGLTLALAMRVVMLMSITWLMGLTEPLFTLMEKGFSFRDLLLIGGGLFLVGKATLEMHADIGGMEEKRRIVGKAGFWAAVMQVVVIDFVFSFDSILTAVGLSNDLTIMVAAVVVSMIVMLFASEHISKFLEDYPTFKMLALAFILMIGVLLMAEGMGVHVPKAYIYSAFGFSIGVETLNSIASKKRARRKK